MVLRSKHMMCNGNVLTTSGMLGDGNKMKSIGYDRTHRAKAMTSEAKAMRGKAEVKISNGMHGLAVIGGGIA